MRRLLAVAAVAAVAGLAAGSARASLTPVEERWAKPLVTVWNQQNAALQLVIKAALAQDALIAGTKANGRLTTILAVFVSCGPAIEKAGQPPSPRLKRFHAALSSACTHDTAGAHDFAQAVGAVRKNKAKLAQSLVTKGAGEFKLGSAAVAKAYHSLIAIGGKSVFKA
ncbi:MAG TPA: hypothetical protein VFB42_01860 [Gaiellaceae bacterium]|nr:hypothetical protein [Gaiellaceae bacterium]